MPGLPSKVSVMALLQKGAVFYFPAEELNTDVPHYFVVLNDTPYKDELVLMVCSTSNISRTKELAKFRGWSQDTIVDVMLNEYDEFKYNSTFDCNLVIERTITQLIEKHEKGNLKFKSKMPNKIVEKLISGVAASTNVENKIKTLL